MLIELALRGRLQLEACGMRRKSLLTRKASAGKRSHLLVMLHTVQELWITAGLKKKEWDFLYLRMIILSNDLKWMCKVSKCFSGEMKCLGTSLVPVPWPCLFRMCRWCCCQPAVGSGSGWGGVAAVTAGGTSNNLLKELAFAMPVRCGLRLKGKNNCQMPDVSCKPLVYFWCTQCCSLCLCCMGRKPSLFLGPLRTQNYLV